MKSCQPEIFHYLCGENNPKKYDVMCMPGSANSRYINFYTDFAFKKFFGTEANKDLLISFLNCLLEREGESEITDITYISTEQLGAGAADRRAVYDVFCETQNKERFIVEMQNARQDNFSDRAIYYSSFAIQRQGERGPKIVGWDYHLTPVYVVGILNFAMRDRTGNPDRVITRVRLKDDDNEVFNENLNFIFLEMTKFKKTEGELDSFMDKWLFAIKNMCKLDGRPAALTEGIFKRLFEVAKIQSYSEKERLVYEESLKNAIDIHSVLSTAKNEGRAEGLAEGLEKGKAEGLSEGFEKGELAMLSKLVLAKKAKGTTPSQIAEMLEVDIKVVEGILNKNK